VILAAPDGALLRCPPLAVLVLLRTGRLVSHPPRTAKVTVFYAHLLNSGIFSCNYQAQINRDCVSSNGYADRQRKANSWEWN